MVDVEYLALVLPQTAVLAFMLWDRRAERREMAAERAALLQRIQAPEQAVMHHAFAELPPSPMPLPYDDDEAFHHSREELAAALMNERE